MIAALELCDTVLIKDKPTAYFFGQFGLKKCIRFWK